MKRLLLYCVAASEEKVCRFTSVTISPKNDMPAQRKVRRGAADKTHPSE